MNKYKLFSRMKGSDIVTLILIQREPGILSYILLSKTINYIVINRGECKGNIDKNIMTVNINLTSLFSLLDKQMNFELEVVDGKAIFTSLTDSKNKIRIKPLSIEYMSDDFKDALDKLFKFDKAYTSGELEEIDLKQLKQLSNVAAKSSKIVQITREFAVLEFEDGFLFQKTKAKPMAISGAVLRNLLTDGGNFYICDNELYYASPDHNNIIILVLYLPRVSVDLSLINDGKIFEKYTFNCNDAARLINYMKNSYPLAYLDMSSGTMVMENDTGETIECDLYLSDAKTVELEKMKKDGVIRDIVMSKLRLPSSIVHAFTLFSGDVDVYVKRNKIIFKKDNFYFVFGR